MTSHFEHIFDVHLLVRCSNEYMLIILPVLHLLLKSIQNNFIFIWIKQKSEGMGQMEKKVILSSKF